MTIKGCRLVSLSIDKYHLVLHILVLPFLKTFLLSHTVKCFLPHAISDSVYTWSVMETLSELKVFF